MSFPCIQPHNDGVVLAVRVTPKSSRAKINGIVDNDLKLSVCSPPENGAANKEVIALLSKSFGIAKSRVEIISGETARNKRLLFHLCSIEEVEAKLEEIV